MIDRPPETARYDRVARTLHWVIAACLIVQVGIGWWMNKLMVDHSPPQERLEGIHISFGLTILLLVLARIAWRLTHRAPPLPAGMPRWEKALAQASHLLFYALMLALPLTGWTLVSLGSRTISFWGLPWPHMPGMVQFFGSPAPRPVRHEIADIHTDILVWTFIANLALHIVGALKHQFDGRPVLWRMTGQAPPAARL